MTRELENVNVTAALPSSVDDWLVLQPLWDLVLANSYYTASPLFLIFVANGFYFVCMVPYIFLDFYALDRWDWVKRYVPFSSTLYWPTFYTCTFDFSDLSKQPKTYF